MSARAAFNHLYAQLVAAMDTTARAELDELLSLDAAGLAERERRQRVDVILAAGGEIG